MVSLGQCLHAAGAYRLVGSVTGWFVAPVGTRVLRRGISVCETECGKRRMRAPLSLSVAKLERHLHRDQQGELCH